MPNRASPIHDYSPRPAQRRAHGTASSACARDQIYRLLSSAILTDKVGRSDLCLS
ncbi:MAG: hypothetical protein PUH21_06260 [Prevotellaceae bacterium]|nr:hypothetical protein [Prevotellaceae bacterium]MDY3855596.1 hypothetical protein [Bacteroidaceae bacterium]